jgi:glycosyltransferase involved in cell wall biosynthesis
MKTFLFLTHDTSLSGAPKTMFLFLDELRKRGYIVDVLALKGGGLENEFKKIARNYRRLDLYSKEYNYDLKSRVFRFLFKKPILSEYDKIYQEILHEKYDLIYANTIVTLKLGVQLKKQLSIPLISHIHEMHTVISEFCPDIKKYEKDVSLFIVPSEINKRCLKETHGIVSTKIEVLRSVSILKNNFTGVKNKIQTVMMSGGAYWRKGDDVFIQIANKVLDKYKEVQFKWYGNISAERRRVNGLDLKNLNIENYVEFNNEKEDLTEEYLSSDLFLLPSREDPFPLSAIEAGMAGLPILCFEKATGISEVISADLVIPYLDIDQISTKIIELLNDINLLKDIGQKNKQVFSEFTAIKQVSRLEYLINSIQ